MSTLVGFRMGRDGADFEPYIPRVSQLSTYFSQHMSSFSDGVCAFLGNGPSLFWLGKSKPFMLWSGKN